MPPLALLWQALIGLPAFRRRAVRDATAAHFVSGLRRSVASAVLVGSLVGIILFRYILPLIPWFGQHPPDLITIFIFAVQHLGDVLAGILVVGQAGLAATWELEHTRSRQRFVSVAAAGLDPVTYFFLPRIYALTVLYLFILFLFKVTAVLAAVYLTWFLEARFFGPEVGHLLVAEGPAILWGYGLNAMLGFAVAVACCALPPATASQHAPAAAIPVVFRRAVVLILLGKLLYFVA